MPAHTPQGPITLAKRDGQAGLLPISAVTEKPKGGFNNQSTRHSGQRTKVVVRRLPPGLSEDEFFKALGEEWRAGRGKVTWANYRNGKVSKDLARYSKPARCFLQLADPPSAQNLAQLVPKTSFIDAKGTQNDVVLLGPPHVEYAIYGRVPNAKRRNDARQGTIDQDPEFMDFLQSLTAPIQKPKALDASDTVKGETVRVTPLIQHLRDKKAAKEKAKTAKQEKQQQDEKKAENQRPTSSRDAGAAKDGKVPSPAKTSAKLASKDVRSPPRSEQRAGSSPRAQPAITAKPGAAQGSTGIQDRRRPGAVSPSTAAARMLQRDLPFQSTRGRAASRGRGGRSPEVRKATLNNAVANGNAIPPAAPPATSQTPTSTNTTAPTTQTTPPSQPNGPPSTTPSAPPNAHPPTAPKAHTISNPTRTPRNTPKDPNGKRAFLKHANASQGITDTTLLTAMRRFGFVTNVTIDTRKGFAYVDFAEPEHLRAAMAASPVPVGQGNVEVLELKNPTRAPPSYSVNGAPRGGMNGVPRSGMNSQQPRGGLTGFRGGRGGSMGRGRGGRPVARGGITNGPVAGKQSPHAATGLDTTPHVAPNTSVTTKTENGANGDAT
ncbi:MAG: hypothetical protein Q9162_005804 [Coniocarpon cinnabarinum]